MMSISTLVFDDDQILNEYIVEKIFIFYITKKFILPEYFIENSYENI